MIYNDLVKLAEEWLRESSSLDTKPYLNSCGAVISGSGNSATEKPYAIGFTSGISILIECKLNHSDFAVGKRKTVHLDSGDMGDYKFYLIPKGLVKTDNIPAKYGLLEVENNLISIVREPEFIGGHKESEVALLASVVRRFQKKSRTKNKWHE